MHINAIKQRAGKAMPILMSAFRGATTTAAGITVIAAGTGIHGCDQLKACRELCLPGCPGNHDRSGFERLAQNLQHAAIELGQLVEKEYVVMGG